MEEGEEVVVVYEYTAALPDELSLKVGDVITRVERIEGGWWRGELNKVRGMFPDNFVKVSFMNYTITASLLVCYEYCLAYITTIEMHSAILLRKL